MLSCALDDPYTRMTLQIGIVGTDGIVIASDRRILNLQWESYGKSLASKVYVNTDVACCWAGRDDADFAARNIEKVDWSTVQDRKGKLTELGEEGWKMCYGNSEMLYPGRQSTSSVLAAFSDPCELWELELFRQSRATQILTHAICGDFYNTGAKHLLGNYLPSGPLPVLELIKLASFSIWMGHKENPNMIEGLEVVIVRPGRPPERQSSDREERLKAACETTWASIHKIFFEPLE